MMNILKANTIIYCRLFEETVHFYQNSLAFPISFSKRWFVEFAVNSHARLSVADAKHATIKSSGGQGLTLSFEVEHIETWFEKLKSRGLNPSDIKTHPWGALVFHILDPEGNRLEFWASIHGDEKKPHGSS